VISTGSSDWPGEGCRDLMEKVLSDAESLRMDQKQK
jgi:hypothetical protein